MRVLLATDGSDDARAATSWLTRFPLPRASHLRVLSVVSIPPSALDVPPVQTFYTALRDAAGRAAAAASSELAPRFSEADVQVLEGDAQEVIVRVAQDWGADLVVLGARGLGAIAGFLLGRVSLGVARHAHCSVLVVKGGADALGIMVGVDGSDEASAAVRFLARLPLDPTTVVRLAGVVQPPAVPATTPGFARGLVQDAIAQIVRERTTALERALVEAADPLAGIVKRVERQVLVGHPVEALGVAAVAPDVGLVVVGARGLGALQRLWLGSVSEGVLRQVDRPVLIVRRPTP